MVSLLAFFVTVSVVMATTTIGTNISTAGDIAFATASSTGQVKFSDITTTGSGITFNSKNLTSVGDIAFATASSTGAVKFPSISSTNGYVRFTSSIDVNGMATTTTQGIVTPASTSTTPTAYCDATNAGGFLWQTATMRLFVCTGAAWVVATTTWTCQ